MFIRLASVVLTINFVTHIPAVVVSVTSPSSYDATTRVAALELERQTSLRRTVHLVAHVPAIVVFVAHPRLGDASALAQE